MKLRVSLDGRLVEVHTARPHGPDGLDVLARGPIEVLGNGLAVVELHPEEERVGGIVAQVRGHPEAEGGAILGVREWMARLPADQYPTLVALAADLTDPDPDVRFRFGLEILIAGLLARER